MAPAAQPQRPPAQTSVAAQAMPHWPQSPGSVARSTQAPLHEVSPGPQLALQLPALQSGLAPPQTVPHWPQSFGSLERSAQLPSGQGTLGGAQLVWHCPATQAAPAGQMLPQPPQFSGSVAVSVQALPQTISEPVQAQPPFTQA